MDIPLYTTLNYKVIYKVITANLSVNLVNFSLETPSGLQSVSAGLEPPDIIELRKTKEVESGMESSETGPALYTILPQKQVEVNLR